MPAREPQLQPLEVQPVFAGHDNLAIQDARRPQGIRQTRDQVGEIGVQSLAVVAVDVQALAVQMNERPEAVQLRLVDLASRTMRTSGSPC